MTEIFLILAEVSWLIAVIIFGGCVGIASFLNNEEPGAATSVFVIVLGLISGIFIWNHSWAEYVTLVKSFGDDIPYIGFYLLAGLVWSFFKWASYIRHNARALVEAISIIKLRFDNCPFKREPWREDYVKELVGAVNHSCRYLTENNLYVADLLIEDQDSLTVERILEKVNFQVGKKKGLITSWIIYWPISMVSVFLQEFVIGLVENIFKFSQGIYNKISRLMFANVISSVIDEAKKHNKQV